jgi:hypothetical protein
VLGAAPKDGSQMSPMLELRREASLPPTSAPIGLNLQQAFAADPMSRIAGASVT